MPHRRHQLGKRRTALAGAAVFCLTRALAYAPQVRTAPVQEPLIAMAAGREWAFLLYVTAWAAVGLCCLVAIPRGNLLWPMTLTSGMAFLWGTAWFLGWVDNRATTWWQTAFTYWCPAVVFAALNALAPRQLELAE